MDVCDRVVTRIGERRPPRRDEEKPAEPALRLAWPDETGREEGLE